MKMTKRKSSTESLETHKRQAMRVSSDECDISQSSTEASTTVSEGTPAASVTPEADTTSSSSAPSPQSPGSATSVAESESTSTVLNSGASPASPIPSQKPTAPALVARDMSPDTDMEITGAITEIKREGSYDGTVVMSTPVPSTATSHPSIALAISQQKQPGKFPIFPSGDVIITADPDLSSKDFQLQLHSSVLARCSPWFARTLTQVDHEDPLPLWYSFRLQKGVGALPVLVRKRTAGERPSIEIEDDVKIKKEDEGEEIGSQKPTKQNALVVQHQKKTSTSVKAYYDTLAYFYGNALPISNTSIWAALLQSEELVKVATALECLQSIRAEINEVLCGFRTKLFLAIKDDPVRWMKIAIATQSGMIYPECLTHLVGSHPLSPWPTKRISLPSELRQLIAAKSRELELLCYEANESLLMSSIMVGKGPVTPDDSQHYETWTAVSIFRDAIATRLHKLDGQSYGRVRGRGAFYRAIAKGGTSFLDYEEVRGLCVDLMKSKWEDLGSDLKLLKSHAAGVVDKLAQNELFIDPDSNGIGYLTCYKPQPSDRPW